VTQHIALLLLMAGIPTGLFAQAKPRAPETSDTTPQVLPTIEVRQKAASGYGVMGTRTATKTDALLRDVPQSVTVVSKSVIADQQMQGMADVVRYMPGVTMAQGEGNRDQATIRGNNTTAGFFVDGMRDDVQYFRDLYNVDALVNVGTVTLEHAAASGLTLRNRSVFADYNKIYQNVFPGAVDSTGSTVQIVGYNNATDRRNLLNETEIAYPLVTGGVRQTLLGGVAVGRQITDNFRNTAYFNDTALAVTTPLSQPTIAAPVTFRPSATDADNHSNATTLSVYGQSQVFLSDRWQAVIGARYERFTINFFNHRNGDALSRTDDLVSPRAGLLFKPAEAVTLYSSYSVSALPSSGDQFSSLTVTTETLEPEKFTNYEVGAKWDVLDRLSLAAAAYRLDRTNTTAPDPIEPSRTVQTGSQQTTGFELNVSGAITTAWQVIGGYTNQKAEVTSATTAAPEGARVALVPRNTVSLWNRYQVASSLGFGLGVIYQDEMFAAIDDQVTLPSFVRVDAAAYYTVNRWVRLQANVENVFDRSYFPTANSNNNITPGSPRAVRVTVATGF
jgi:catecholate siderophore receptor